MTRPMPSDVLLRHVLLAYERLARTVEGGGDPELGLATSFACGCRALRARAEAESWLVPPSLVAEVERLVERMAEAAEDEVGVWLDAFPNRVLAMLERRSGAIAPTRAPRRRWIDRVADRRPVARPGATFTGVLTH